MVDDLVIRVEREQASGSNPPERWPDMLLGASIAAPIITSAIRSAGLNFESTYTTSASFKREF
jgi:hypothetical protein